MKVFGQDFAFLDQNFLIGKFFDNFWTAQILVGGVAL